MNYYEHAVLSAKKFNCNIEDTLFLHEIMDSSKLHFSQWQHRMFSHNTWFVDVVMRLYEKFKGNNIIENTKTGGQILVRDVLIEHLLDDHCKTPSIVDWLNCIKFNTTEKWINNPDRKKIEYLKSLQNDK